MVKINRSKVKRVFCSVDWGFTNPGVILVFAVDNEDRMYLVHQVYQSSRVISWWIEQATKIQEHFKPEIWICDPAEPANISDFRSAGMTCIAADNAVSAGIQRVQERLKVAKNETPRLQVLDSSLEHRDEGLVGTFRPTSVQDEFTSYVWPKSSDGRPIKEEPIKVNDHALDALRYAVSYLDKRSLQKMTSRKRPAIGI